MSAPLPKQQKDRTMVFIVLAILLAFVAGTLFGIILAETRPRTLPYNPPCITAPCIPPPQIIIVVVPPDSPPIIVLPPVPEPIIVLPPPPCAHPDPQPSHGRDPACHGK